MSALRVLHLITTIEKGGAENAIFTLALAQVTAGYKVTVIPLKGRPELQESLSANGVKVDLSLLGQSLHKQIRILRRFRNNESVIHAHLPRSELIARWVWGRGRVVFTRHNAEPFLPHGSKLLSRLLSRWVTQSAQIIVISQAVRDFILASKEVGRHSVINVIYYGYKPRYSNNTSKNANSRLPKTVQLGTVSRLAEQKHIPLLINLAKNLLEDGIQFELNIVGDGPEKTKLDQLVRQLELENHVHFLGRTQDVSNFMNSLDMFLLTSRYEGFGLVLLEAIDHGLPIVASNTSAIPEVLGERHPGLFPVGDLETLTYRVTSFLRNSAKRKACVEYQYSRLKRFTVNEYFERHEDIYNAFLRQKL